MWRPAAASLLCALLVAASHAAVLSGQQAADCSALRSLLAAKGVSPAALAQTLHTGAEAGEVCGANPCCSRPWEIGLRDVVQREFRKQLLDSTDQLKNLLHEQAVAVQDTLLRVVHVAGQSTVSTYNEQNQDSGDSVAREAIPTLFDSLMAYLQSKLSDHALEDAVDAFFDDLFVAAYRDVVQPGGAALNASLTTCLRERRADLRPFRQAPYRMKERLLRSLGLAKLYLQSLYVGIEVLNSTTEFEYSGSCYDALTRLSYCPACQRIGEVKPCGGLCLNVMRGCMAPLSTLSPAWNTYVGVLKRLATSLQQSNNVKSYLLKMYINISEAVMLVWNNKAVIEREVAETCGGASPAPESSQQRRRREMPLQYRQSSALGVQLPERQHEISLDSEQEPDLGSLLRNFNSLVEQHQRLYRGLPDMACNERATNQQNDCWNGTSVGDYTRPLAGVGLDSQQFNPEVDVPYLPDPELESEADRLDHIRQLSVDKLVSMPAGEDLTDDFWVASGSGGWPAYDDDEDPYIYDYDYGSGSGDGDDFIDEAPFDGILERTTAAPSDEDEESALTVAPDADLDDDGGDEEGDVPQLNIDPLPPTTTQSPKKEPLPSSAAAVDACWPLLLLLLTALAAGRL